MVATLESNAGVPPPPSVDPALRTALDAVNVAVQRELRSPTRANRKATEAAQAEYQVVCKVMLEDIARELDAKAKPTR